MGIDFPCPLEGLEHWHCEGLVSIEEDELRKLQWIVRPRLATSGNASITVTRFTRYL